MPLPTVRDYGLERDSFWTMANEIPPGATISFKRFKEDEHHIYLISLKDHPQRKGITMSLRLIRV